MRGAPQPGLFIPQRARRAQSIVREEVTAESKSSTSRPCVNRSVHRNLLFFFLCGLCVLRGE